MFGGFQLPSIPLIEVFGNGERLSPAQIAAIGSNTGIMELTIPMLI